MAKKANKEHLEDNKKEQSAVLDIQALANRIRDDSVKIAVAEVRRDFRDLAYRVFAIELSIYGLIKGEKNLTEEEKSNVMKQQDILTANVESMLKRLAEIDQQAKQEDKS
jgi:hypothetical protein